MFINIDNDYLLKDFFNFDNRNDVLNPQEGLTIANMFYDLYLPYKNYKPKELKATSEQDQLLLRIQELSFAVNDLNLYLDIYPNDQKIFHLFKSYVKELKKYCENYAEKYEALEITDDVKEEYTWYKKPWPWEVRDV